MSLQLPRLLQGHDRPMRAFTLQVPSLQSHQNERLVAGPCLSCVLMSHTVWFVPQRVWDGSSAGGGTDHG